MFHYRLKHTKLLIPFSSGSVELVPHLPPRLGFRWHPHPHARHKDGGSLQARLRPTKRLAGPAPALLVPDGHAAEAGLLLDPVRQTGKTGRHKADVCVHPSVDHATGSSGGTGAEYIS